MRDWNAVFERLDGLSRVRPLTDAEVTELCKAIDFLDRHRDDIKSRHIKLWSDLETDILCDMIADGASFAQAGKALGRSKNSAISRFRFVAAEMGWQAT